MTAYTFSTEMPADESVEHRLERISEAYDGLVKRVIVTAVAMVVFAILVACYVNNRAWEKEIIQRGHAVYVMDPATGGVEWKWKEEGE